jgi:NAD+ diphosphatase
MSPRANPFSGNYLDRRAEWRERGDWWDEARRDAETLYLAMHGTSALLAGAEGVPAGVAWLRGDDPRVLATPAERHILLGWFRGQRCVLVRCAGAAGEAPVVGVTAPGQWLAELRPVAADLAPDEAGLLAYARALAIWHDNHRHCGRCGAATQTSRAGHARRCGQCGHESFPRIDPAIIVLVHNRGRALLGRQPSWPAGRYSTIAGFVEPGESLEDAVRREVLEETRIAVGQIEYHSSQPWPFPASLMLGFMAEGLDGEPRAHDNELEDVRWFSREQVRRGEILLPPAESISRRLITQWLDSA